MYIKGTWRVWCGKRIVKDKIDALYMSGTDSSITAAFAVSSILVIIAVIVLILKNVFEYRQKNAKKGGVK